MYENSGSDFLRLPPRYKDCRRQAAAGANVAACRLSGCSAYYQMPLPHRFATLPTAPAIRGKTLHCGGKAFLRNPRRTRPITRPRQTDEPVESRALGKLLISGIPLASPIAERRRPKCLVHCGFWRVECARSCTAGNPGSWSRYTLPNSLNPLTGGRFNSKIQYGSVSAF
jgi:hypothetical protein